MFMWSRRSSTTGSRMTGVSDRHEGDLGGVLGRWDRRRELSVEIRLDESADAVGVQHTAWMLTNLLARMDGVVASLHIVGPEVVLARRVVPQGEEGGLVEALVAGAERIKVVPTRSGVHSGGADLVLAVGPGPCPDQALRVHGDGWCGVLVMDDLPAGRGSSLPFGPYVSACLAAGRVFLLSRAPGQAQALNGPVAWSLWSHRAGGLELMGDGPAEAEVELDAGLAGVGAVGCAALHAAWACPGVSGRLLVVDGDVEGVDPSNLNRSVLFNADSIGQPKALAAAAQLADGSLDLDARHGRYELQPDRPQMLLSAVDTNQARAALQAQYPTRILGASTFQLRAEVVRVGPPGAGLCLRCHNQPGPPARGIADDVLRQKMREADPEQARQIVEQAGVPLEDAQEWSVTGQCGTVSQALLSYLAEEAAGQDQPAEWAVAFVSVFAGTALGAETVKERMGSQAPLGQATNRATFQFLRPAAAINGGGFETRDPDCTACAPGIARDLWLPRFDAWGARREG